MRTRISTVLIRRDEMTTRVPRKILKCLGVLGIRDLRIEPTHHGTYVGVESEVGEREGREGAVR